MVENIRNIVDQMLSLSWPMIVISIVIVVSLRVVDIIIKKEKIVLYQEILKLFFIIYILCLFQIVTYKDVSYSNTNFIPFKEIFRYDFGSYLFYKNILGNMLLFMPFGLFVGYFLKVKKTYVIVILSLIASVAIETTQLAIGRVFDVDDVILNVLGSVVGFAIYYLIDKFYDIIPEKLKKEWIINILTVLFIVLVVRFLML